MAQLETERRPARDAEPAGVRGTTASGRRPPREDAPEEAALAPGRLPLLVALAGLGVVAGALLVLGFATLALLVAAGAIEPGGCNGPQYSLDGADIPPQLIPIYERAAARYHLGPKGPAVLAAINEVETDFGRDLSTSSAGAVGWMQFEPTTWATYGVDGDGDGIKNPNDPWDAIFSAANYLSANGAPGDWQRAILAYNHADWYVEEVLTLASQYQRAGGGATAVPVSEACAAPPGGGSRLARLIAEANRIDALRSAYVYGGGHVTPAPATPPWDCSSAWSRLIQVAGYDIPTMDSTGFMSWGDPGPGRYVTIYATPAHVYGTIEGRPWGTSSSNPRNPGGGPAWLPYATNPIPDFPGGTPTVRHPPGL